MVTPNLGLQVACACQTQPHTAPRAWKPSRCSHETLGISRGRHTPTPGLAFLVGPLSGAQLAGGSGCSELCLDPLRSCWCWVRWPAPRRAPGTPLQHPGSPCRGLGGDTLCRSLSAGRVHEGPPYSRRTVPWSCAVAIGRSRASPACTPEPGRARSGTQGWWGAAAGPVVIAWRGLRPVPRGRPPPPGCGDRGERGGLGPGVGGTGQRS